MSKSTKHDSGRATARRRLIRGVFAAPAALTLYSGNVFATSSNLRALANQFKDKKHPGLLSLQQGETEPSDTWIRVRVFLSDGVKVVSGSEVTGKPGCGVDTGFVGMGGWATVATPSESHVPTGDPSPTDEFAALRFNDLGVIVGVSTGDADALSTALTKSAGTSLGVVDGCW